MIEEIQTELDFVPDVIFCSVGGGSLLGGIIHGCAAGWSHGGSRNCGCVCVTPDLITRTVPIVAIEPLGSNCFYSSMALNMPWKEMYQIEDIKGMATDMNIKEIGEGLRVAHLRSVKTCATSLAAPSPAPKTIDRAMMRTGEVTCVCVPDEMMMSTAISFAGDAIPPSHLRCYH